MTKYIIIASLAILCGCNKEVTYSEGLIPEVDISASAATGDCSASSATGDYSASAATGKRSFAASIGDVSSAEILPSESAKNSVAIAIGSSSKVRAPLGCWIVCAEWVNDVVIGVKTVKVDGKKIKENTWYTVKRGKFVEA